MSTPAAAVSLPPPRSSFINTAYSTARLCAQGRDFADRDTFRDGSPILVMNYRQQVILDPSDGGTFTVMNLNSVVTSEAFALGGDSFRLGKERDQFRVHYSGASPTAPPPPNGFFAGYAVAIEPVRGKQK